MDSTILQYFIFILAGFVLGSIRFAYWIPKLFANIDITKKPEDHNPGVANAFTYGGFWLGILSLIMELAKGFVPVILAVHFTGTASWLFALVMIAPVLGHGFPFFDPHKGGKAIAVSFGVVLGLYPEVRPFIYLAFLYIFFSIVVILEPHAFRSIMTFDLFAVLVFLHVPVLSIRIGCSGIAGIVILKHLMKHTHQHLHVKLFTSKWQLF